MRHKQAMAALQSRIASMQSQLLIGGQKIEDTPQFRCGGKAAARHFIHFGQLHTSNKVSNCTHLHPTRQF